MLGLNRLAKAIRGGMWLARPNGLRARLDELEGRLDALHDLGPRLDALAAWVAAESERRDQPRWDEVVARFEALARLAVEHDRCNVARFEALARLAVEDGRRDTSRWDELFAWLDALSQVVEDERREDGPATRGDRRRGAARPRPRPGGARGGRAGRRAAPLAGPRLRPRDVPRPDRRDRLAVPAPRRLLRALRDVLDRGAGQARRRRPRRRRQHRLLHADPRAAGGRVGPRLRLRARPGELPAPEEERPRQRLPQRRLRQEGRRRRLGAAGAAPVPRQQGGPPDLRLARRPRHDPDRGDRPRRLLRRRQRPRPARLHQDGHPGRRGRACAGCAACCGATPTPR